MPTCIYYGLGKRFPYNKLFEKMDSNKIIINMDGMEENHQAFAKYNGIQMIESIIYKYDETQFMKKEDIKQYKKELENMQRINPNWTIKGERLVKIYKYSII